VSKLIDRICARTLPTVPDAGKMGMRFNAKWPAVSRVARGSSIMNYGPVYRPPVQLNRELKALQCGSADEETIP
jgi:hypothetical protein